MLQRPNEKLEDIENLIMKDFSHILGRRVKVIVTGGAPTSPTVKEFLKKCFKSTLIDSYGISEVGGILSEGKLNQKIQIKLQSVPEMGYFISDNPPRGEILAKSPFMASGYIGDPKLTQESFVDGYFRTGDIGSIDKDGNLIVIDRKKNIFKLSQGEFVAIEKLETIFSESPFIDQIFLCGHPSKSYLVSIVVPHFENSVQYLKRLNLQPISSSWTIQEVCQSLELQNAILTEFKKIGKEYFLQGFEIPRAVYLESESWSLENELLTGKKKLSK